MLHFVRTMRKTTLILFMTFSIIFWVPIHTHAEKVSKINLKKLSSLKIPENLGNLDEVWIPNSSYGLQVPTKGNTGGNPSNTEEASKPISPKIIIHVRDAHSIYEAQKNIAQLIELLNRRYQVRLVCLEGASGKIDTSVLNQFSDPTINRRVLEDLVREGKVTGAEYAAAVLGAPITIYGIENPTLYQENVKAYRTLAQHREKVTQVFTLFERQLEDLSEPILSPTLRGLVRLVYQYEEGKIQASEYGLSLLKSYEENVGAMGQKEFLDLYPNISLFVEKEKLEKEIDFQKVEDERAKFFSEAAAKLEGEGMNDLVAKSLEFRLGRLSGLDYYSYLDLLMGKVYPSVEEGRSKYPELAKFIQYEKLFSRIQGKALFDEWDRLRDALYMKLAKSEDERGFVSYSKTLKVFKRLYRSEFTQLELAEYLSRKEEFDFSGMVTFLKENSKKHNVRIRDGFFFVDESKFKALLPAANDFYELAEKRNESLTDHLLEAMDSEDAKVAILVAGGFHTEAIKRVLKEKGLAYAVITPNIQNEVFENPYLKVMMDKRNPLEKFIIDFEAKGAQEGGIKK